MKKMLSWQVILGIVLVSASAVLYLVHYLIFRDAYFIFTTLLINVAFIPIDVLLVAIIIHQLLEVRARNERMEKLNMVIGVFFSEVGTDLLSAFAKLDRRIDDIKAKLIFGMECPEEDFDGAEEFLISHSYEVNVKSSDLKALGELLGSKRDFLLRLLENPNLLEHESFSGLLRAVFHLTEELSSRHSHHDLPARDLEHVAVDIKRAYSQLVKEWINYMKHLRGNYPFLFSHALRTNPFDPDASVVIK